MFLVLDLFDKLWLRWNLKFRKCFYFRETSHSWVDVLICLSNADGDVNFCPSKSVTIDDIPDLPWKVEKASGGRHLMSGCEMSIDTLHDRCLIYDRSDKNIRID